MPVYDTCVRRPRTDETRDRFRLGQNRPASVITIIITVIVGFFFIFFNTSVVCSMRFFMLVCVCDIITIGSHRVARGTDAHATRFQFNLRHANPMINRLRPRTGRSAASFRNDNDDDDDGGDVIARAGRRRQTDARRTTVGKNRRTPGKLQEARARRNEWLNYNKGRFLAIFHAGNFNRTETNNPGNSSTILTMNFSTNTDEQCLYKPREIIGSFAPRSF